MILYGSRAICFHMPSFREPKDWDLIASEEELKVIASRLPSIEWKRRPGQTEDPPLANQPEDKKHTFVYDGHMVEVARTAYEPYCQRVYDFFSDAPTMEDPVLGVMHVPSLDYLLMTKQCGLAFPVTHWHKNLRDIYVMRDVVKKTSPGVAALWTDTWRNAERMYADSHSRRNHQLRCCHPEVKQPEDMALHRILHERISQNQRSFDEVLLGWNGNPDGTKEERRAAMTLQLSEEARVVAAERMRAYLLAHPETPITPDILQEATTRWLRWALREMAVGPLPIEWRYFVVIHYREIRDMVKPDWALELQDLILPVG